MAEPTNLPSLENDVFDNIKTRRSVRFFDQNRPVDRSIIEKVVEAGAMAPSSCNRQAWDFIVIDDAEVKKRLISEANFFYAEKIPTIVFVLYDSRISEEKYANVQSATCASQNMFLYSHSIGLGCWWIVACGDVDRIRQILNIPKDKLIVTVLGFGYLPEGKKVIEPKRKKVDEVIHYNYFGEQFAKHPKNWSFEEMAQYRGRSIFSISPDIEYRAYFPDEEKNILEYLQQQTTHCEVIHVAYEFTGRAAYHLANVFPDKKVVLITSSEDEVKWHESRRDYLKIPNLDVTSQWPSNAQAIVLLEALNIFPNADDIMKNAQDSLAKGGKLFVSVFNQHSFYGLYNRKGIFVRSGFERAWTLGTFRKMLSKYVKVKDSIGFNVFPNAEIVIPKSGFEGMAKFKKYYWAFRGVSLNGATEKVKSRHVLKGICRHVIFECEKI